MREYQIAVFTVDWNYELVESTLHGLKRYVDEHENVSLRIFDCFGKELNSAKDKSEYAIFDLPDMDQFDGVLVQGNQIVLQGAREALSRRIVESRKPAVTIGCKVEGCTLVSVDNEAAQHDIAEHVIRDHGARRLVYLTGFLDNGCPEGQQRMAGFLRACREQGVRDEDIRIVPGTWRTSDGATLARKWLAEKKPLPDAFISANDEMALGVMEVLVENGYRIPEDVIIVGYDNVSSAELSTPRLSTVDGNNSELNYQAMDVLISKIEGVESKEYCLFPHSLVYSESCGCHEASKIDYIRSKYFQQNRFLKNFYALQDKMAEELFEANDLTNLMDTVEQTRSIFGCDNVYLCFNDYYFDNYEKTQWKQDSESFGKEMVLATQGECGREADANHLYARFPTRQLLPKELMRKNRFLVFYPLHYNTYSIGYLVMDSISEAAKLNLHESLFSFLEIAMENVRKKCLLRQLNGVLDDLYVRDSLTGLYNRFGYKRFGEDVFQSFLERDGSVQILFIDMDEMKLINDQFGHEAGDTAIIAAADTLKSVCQPEDFIMRYGGDEFLAIASGKRLGLEDTIQQAVREKNGDGSLPFPLSLSVGVIRADRAQALTLDGCVQKADTLMYEEKNRHKSGKQ